ncbi:retrovirus-related pol polyprotein from transposon TNT 1-94 [Tanacetum coccineum]
MESAEADFFENIFPYKDKEKQISNLRKRVMNDQLSQDEIDNNSEVPQENVEPRRSKRAKVTKDFGPDYITYIVNEEPQTYKAAMESSEAPYWKEAIQSEIDSIVHNNTWKLVDLPSGHKLIGHKWIFKKKLRPDGNIEKYKARLVAKGYHQKEGQNFFDTYSPVTRLTSIRTLIAIVAIHNLIIHQIDVKTAFLNGELDEEIYMQQPEGFVVKDMGEADVILGIRIQKNSNGYILTQSHYIEKTLKKFGHYDDRPVVTPFDPKVQLKKNKEQSVSQLQYTQVLGSLLYIMNCARPDLAYNHTMAYGLHYTKYPPVLEGYCDANWISSHNEGKSTSGYVFTLGGAAVSWRSSKQTVNTKSTIKAEFVALDKAAEEA